MILNDDLQLGEKIANSLENNCDFSENSDSEMNLALEIASYANKTIIANDDDLIFGEKIANYANNSVITEFSYNKLDSIEKISQAIEESRKLKGKDFWDRNNEIGKAIENLKNTTKDFSEKDFKNSLTKVKKILEAIRANKDIDYIIALQNSL